jgi:hypothetical protein
MIRPKPLEKTQITDTDQPQKKIQEQLSIALAFISVFAFFFKILFF